MTAENQNNKRIAKNTLLLYFRMLLLMVVSLYTSRVTLAALGVEDYGIYNVVGGVVAMFSVLSGSLSAAISRFITFELGRGDLQRLKTVFSTSVNIQIGLALIIMVLAEIGGVWFLNYKMNIASERLAAANWVLQCSILTFMVNLISVPYNAAIIAHERMSAFAYISILEAVLKLLVVYLLYITLYDRLIVYAILLCSVAVILRLIYGVYCKRHFEECSYHFVYDKSVLKSMTGFAGWNFIGASSSLLMTQGVNILMNLFFTVSVNAARGVVTQVETAVMGFANNFMTAINPQITKSYASGDLFYMHKLVCIGSKYSYFLLFFFALPLMLEANTVLSLWLKVVPEYAPMFLRLSLSISLVSVLSNTLVTSMLATGDIKKYQIIVGGTGMLVFPFAYISYRMGMPPQTAYFIHFAIFVLQLVYRLFLLKDMIDLPIGMFLREVIQKILLVTFVASIIPIVLSFSLPNGNQFIRLLIVTIVSITCSLISIIVLGLTRNERTMLLGKIRTMQNKIFSKNGNKIPG